MVEKSLGCAHRLSICNFDDIWKSRFLFCSFLLLLFLPSKDPEIFMEIAGPTKFAEEISCLNGIHLNWSFQVDFVPIIPTSLFFF